MRKAVNEAPQAPREDHPEFLRIARAYGFAEASTDNKNLIDMWAEGGGQIPLSWLVPWSTFIGGKTGSGKSNTGGVLLEEFGKYNIPFTCWDEENEFVSLRDKFPVQVIPGSKLLGSSEKETQELTRKYATTVVLKGRMKVITFDPGISIEERSEMLLAYIKTLYYICDQTRIPHMLYVDEASTYFPQGSTEYSKSNDLIAWGGYAAKKGRKRNFGLMLATQTMAEMNKKVTRQVYNRILGLVDDPTDLERYYNLLRGRNDNNRLRETIYRVFPRLRPGEFIFLRDSHQIRGKVRLRHTYHKSKTMTPFEALKQLEGMDYSKYGADIVEGI